MVETAGSGKAVGWPGREEGSERSHIPGAKQSEGEALSKVLAPGSVAADILPQGWDPSTNLAAPH